MKKYELIKESKTYFEGREIYRIRALKDFRNVRAGDVGGWVCSYNNLSQEGNCWIYGNAKCLDNATVSDNAKMYDSSMMLGNAKMYDNAVMSDSSVMCDNAVVCGNARMCDTSTMCDNSMMRGNAMMFNNSKMYDRATMFDNSKMFDNAEMFGRAIMFDNAVMCDNAKMFDNAEMCDRATLDKDKLLYGSINKSYKKIFQYHCEKRLLTAILTEENEILYSVGCQTGITKEEFIDRIYNDCEIKGKGLEEYPYRQEYLDIIDMAENYLRKFTQGWE